ncbi:MAG: hypothetical protein IJ366_07740 [Clostridia bacterium]|nr:hypothetical protein [Clostridia bacterium]
MKKTIALIALSATTLTSVLGVSLLKNTSNTSAIEAKTAIECDTTSNVCVAIEDINLSTEDFILKTSTINVSKPSKQNILYMMLNSIDYYNYASGTIAYANPKDLSSSIVVDFQSDITNSNAYSHTIQKNVSITDINKAVLQSDTTTLTATNEKNTDYLADREVCYNGGSATVANNIHKTYSSSTNSAITRAEVPEIANKDRFRINEDGIPCYRYRANPTNIHDASMCLFPQEMAFGFLLDLDMWEIEGSTTYEGRECVVLSGNTNEEYGSKIGVDKFTFYVDKLTGTLLKYVGYDSKGEISDYMVSSGISFDNVFNIESSIEILTAKSSSYTAEK